MRRLAPRIDLDQFVSYRLSVLSSAWGAASARFYRKRFGLALREWRVLAVLSGRGGETGTPASEIVRLTAVEKAGISRALASLERRGLIARAWSDSDGRRSLVALTTNGRALLRRLVPAALARQALLVGALTAVERKTFFTLLGKLERRVAELDGASGPPARRKRR
ncbi:MAG TPA: MarR family transcriptional regulator [Burkholderiales bacterium]|nr:MarR family transcriptional regulator [Burkholderiales bacterium]